MAQSNALVNAIIYDKCCRKIVLNWTILEVDSEDSISRITFHACQVMLI